MDKIDLSKIDPSVLITIGEKIQSGQPLDAEDFREFPPLKEEDQNFNEIAKKAKDFVENTDTSQFLMKGLMGTLEKEDIKDFFPDVTAEDVKKVSQMMSAAANKLAAPRIVEKFTKELDLSSPEDVLSVHPKDLGPSHLDLCWALFETTGNMIYPAKIFKAREHPETNIIVAGAADWSMRSQPNHGPEFVQEIEKWIQDHESEID